MCESTVRKKRLAVHFNLTTSVIRNLPTCNLLQVISWVETHWSHLMTSRGQRTLVNIKTGTFSSVQLVSFHSLCHHFPIIFPTVHFLFGHFPKLPTDSLIKSQVPSLMFKVLYNLTSRILLNNIYCILS